MKKLVYVMVVLLLLGSTQVFAAGTKPVQVALFNPVQIFKEDTSIKGFRLNFIYGVNANLEGLDLGLVNQINGNVKGVQVSAVNMSKGDVSVFQWGFYNYAGKMKGLQLGVVNNTGRLEGLQIGLVNINGSKDPFYILPFVNFSFK
jgi:hypothetical protein